MVFQLCEVKAFLKGYCDVYEWTSICGTAPLLLTLPLII